MGNCALQTPHMSHSHTSVVAPHRFCEATKACLAKQTKLQSLAKGTKNFAFCLKMSHKNISKTPLHIKIFGCKNFWFAVSKWFSSKYVAYFSWGMWFEKILCGGFPELTSDPSVMVLGDVAKFGWLSMEVQDNTFKRKEWVAGSPRPFLTLTLLCSL